ncbi:MAG: purine-binding chemotaxis protein CheW [Actinobacteria bacterium]|jgi:purine-binding chemotaxis protein CheW|nr:purine-binding chemotaxis protein CheW [Actinomycetota bacterium]
MSEPEVGPLQESPEPRAGVTETDPIREILRRRARELAKTPDAEVGGARLMEILEFSLGPERYAFETSFVREVFPLIEITPLPNVPPYILGVVNVRGRILSVMDIRRLMDFVNVGLTNLNKAIILHNGEMELAVLADEIAGVYAIDGDQGQRALATLSGKREEYLKGVTQDRVVVLDAEKLLASEDLLVRSGL